MFEREPHLHHVFAGFGPCFRSTRSWLFVIRTLFSPRFWVLNGVDFTMTASFDVMPPQNHFFLNGPDHWGIATRLVFFFENISACRGLYIEYLHWRDG